ncbi:MAG: GxxExxY protein [Anaerolineales bacterium]
MQKRPFIQQKPNIPFPHAELTHKIIGICYEIANELGSGFLESVYQNALGIAFRQANMKALSQVRMSVAFRGENVGDFIADFLIEGKVIVEIKAVTSLAPEHSAQVLNYLKASNLDVGLLVNFGRPSIEIRHLHHPRLQASARVNLKNP